MPTEDEKFMAMALQEARKGEFQTWPNPWVGAVVVRLGKVVGRGWHRGAGLPHAEIEALQMAGAKAKGATLYVSLEPCVHYGRTPPCTEAVLAAKIKRVVAGCPDPGPKAGGGLEKLKAKGLQIGPWTLRTEAEDLIRHFLFSSKSMRPWFTLKAAASLDGRTATSRGESQWITSAAARDDARRLRGHCDGVLVGAGTVAKDQPGLLPQTGGGFVPWRLVLDPRGQLKGNESVFRDEHVSRTVWFAGLPAFVNAMETARRRGVHIEALHAGGLPGAVRSALEWMRTHHLRRVMVEGGATTLGAFVRLGLADELVLYVAPKLEASGRGLPIFHSDDELPLKDWPKLYHLSAESLGPELRLTASFYEHPRPWGELPKPGSSLPAKVPTTVKPVKRSKS